MTTIGQTIAAARESAGHSLADLSARTCIRRPVLAGIEADDFGPCGGDFYARGHIRAVCRELGIDSGDLLRRFDSEYAHERSVPAFTGKAVTAGMHAAQQAERDRREDSGPRETGTRGGDPAADRARGSGGRTAPRTTAGSEEAAQPVAAAVPRARGPEPAAAAPPARRGKHGKPAPGEEHGEAARRDDDSRTGAGAPAHDTGAGGDPRATRQVPKQRRERKSSLLAATIAAARRTWPLLVIAAIGGAAVAAAVASWPDGPSGQSADAGRLLQREPAADAAPAPTPEHARSAAPSPEPAPEPSYGIGLSSVTTPERKAEEVRLSVTATERVWLRVTDAEGDNRFTGVLDKGTERAWNHPDELRLHLGKASAVRVTVNGEHRGAPAADARVAHLTYSATDLA
ncbi:helix-turn-helix domain-containing protein [Streptomonospora litoralis]|uniref:Cytoskeletal protein RodZ n=1 Tax=Streptomonospora litoralis TaxID=2498135 RepID=A0A4P6PYP1_9ACTN|nr:helix-turn-helix domain-containing protein [Streptomonospora litoralis]QBI53253.1 cytoskeletal protein RodZ [Streptomonospora litoralis]